LRFDGGRVNVRGGFTLSGPVFIGNTTIGITSGGDAIFFDTVNGNGSATFASLTFIAGGLTRPSPNPRTRAPTWSGGTMGGNPTIGLPGVTNLRGGLSVPASAASPFTASPSLFNRTLNNFGAATVAGPFDLSNGATVNNQTGASWTLQGTGSIGGDGTFNNFGTLQSTGNDSIGSDSFPVSLNNSGTFNVQSGTVTVNNTVNNAGT